MKYASIEHGKQLKEADQIDAAWSVFYKALLEVEYQLKSVDQTTLRKEQFDCLYEIGLIQQAKFHHEAAYKTFEKAENIRLSYLSELQLAPIQYVGLPKWKNDFKTIQQLEKDEHYYALVDVGKRLIDEIESLDYSQQTRDHWRLLMQTSEALYMAFSAIDDPEQAEIYDEKAEDLSFMHDLDRFSSYDE